MWILGEIFPCLNTENYLNKQKLNIWLKQNPLVGLESDCDL